MVIIISNTDGKGDADLTVLKFPETAIEGHSSHGISIRHIAAETAEEKSLPTRNFPTGMR